MMTETFVATALLLMWLFGPGRGDYRWPVMKWHLLLQILMYVTVLQTVRTVCFSLCTTAHCQQALLGPPPGLFAGRNTTFW